MENASKALIMAGSMLIGVIIISIGVYIFTTFGGSSKNIQEQVDNRVLAEFNNNFEKFLGSDECTIHDIVNTISFAKKNNKEFEFTDADRENPYYIEVYAKDIGYNNKNLSSDSIVEDDYLEWFKNYSVNNSAGAEVQLLYFRVSNIEYSELNIDGSIKQRVKSITFEIKD